MTARGEPGPRRWSSLRGRAWPVPTDGLQAAASSARAACRPAASRARVAARSPYPLFMTRAQGSRITRRRRQRVRRLPRLVRRGPARPQRRPDQRGRDAGDGRARRLVLDREPARGGARRATRRHDPVGRAGRLQLHRAREATFHAIRLARAFTGRERILKFEGNYHGWHDYVAWSHHFATDDAATSRHRSPRRPASRSAFATSSSSASTTTPPASARCSPREGDSIAAVILEPVFHNAGVVLPEPGFLETLREACTDGRHGPHLRRGHHRLPPRPGWGAGALRRHARPDDPRQGARQRLPDLGALSAGPTSWTGSGPRATCCSRARSPGTRSTSRWRSRCTTDRARGRDPRAHRAVSASASRAASRRPSTRPACPVQVRESAGVWTVYFTDQPIRRFRDFARFAMDKNHPVQRAYRDWLLERGIYVHPHYMIRGFLTGAHTDDDVDRVVEATAELPAGASRRALGAPRRRPGQAERPPVRRRRGSAA